MSPTLSQYLPWYQRVGILLCGMTQMPQPPNGHFMTFYVYNVPHKESMTVNTVHWKYILYTCVEYSYTGTDKIDCVQAATTAAGHSTESGSPQKSESASK